MDGFMIPVEASDLVSSSKGWLHSSSCDRVSSVGWSTNGRPLRW